MPSTGSATAADTLRAHLHRVVAIRDTTRAQGLEPALRAVQQLQVARFRWMYADFLASDRYGQAASFFLQELYGAQDYAARDAQFARIAGAIERLFPAKVMTLAVSLAHVHALSEELDGHMALCWQRISAPGGSVGRRPSKLSATEQARRYVACWTQTGRPADRAFQLSTVLELGNYLTELVRLPGLRTALRLMRRPAEAAGLGALQQVLETGFDAFKAMGNTEAFLQAIASRESVWMQRLFTGDHPVIEELATAL